MVLVCFLIEEFVFSLLLLLCFVFLYLGGRYQTNPRHHTLQGGLLYLFHLDIRLLTFVNCLFYYICPRLWRASILSFLRLLRATFCTFQFVVSLAGNFFLFSIRSFGQGHILLLIYYNSLLFAPASGYPPSTRSLGCSFEFPASCFLRLPLIKVEFIREDCILEN